MKLSERNKTEYANRINEVLDFDTSSIKNKEQAVAFIQTITQLIDFIENTPYYKHLINMLFADKKLSRLDIELVELGNKVIKCAEPLYDMALTFIAENKIDLPDAKEIWEKMPAGTFGNLGLEMTTSMEIDSLKNRLAPEAKVAYGQIKDFYYDFLHISWDFNDLAKNTPFTDENLKEIKQLTDYFQAKYSQYQRLQNQIGQSTYKTLESVWVHETANEHSKEYALAGMDFGFSPLGSFIRQPQSSGYDLNQVRNDVEKYKEAVKTMRNRVSEEEASFNSRFLKKLGRVSTSFLRQTTSAISTNIVGYLISFIVGVVGTALIVWLKHLL